MAAKCLTHQTIDIDLPADTVEWSPWPDKPMLACGRYKLNQSETETATGMVPSAEGQTDSGPQQRRSGGLIVYRLEGESDTWKLSEVCRDSGGGVLDTQWCPQKVQDRELIAKADSDGMTTLLALNDEGTSLDVLASEKNVDNDVINLALDWSNRLHASTEPSVAVSAANGTASLYRLTNQGLQFLRHWKAHSVPWLPVTEAWTCSFDCWQPACLYTGGEDSCLKLWDTRTDCSLPSLSNKNGHAMGVCSIQSHTGLEFWLATGSYDDTVRVWDTRHLHQPIAEHCAGGGVWRIKWGTEDPHAMLCACIYNHFRVLQTNATGGDIPQVAEYLEHSSLAYGADWFSPSPGSGVQLAATCSFYDHTLKLWSCDLRSKA